MPYIKILLALFILISACAHADEKWTDIVITDTMKISVLSASLDTKFSLTRNKANEEIFIAFGTETNYINKTIEIRKWYIRTKDCDIGYGNLVILSPEGDFLFDSNFIIDGKRIVDDISNALCRFYKKASQFSTITPHDSLQITNVRADEKNRIDILAGVDNPHTSGKKSVIVSISGEIKSGDAKIIQKRLNALTSKEAQYHLEAIISSDGGDVYESMAIGRILRRYKFDVKVLGRCLSACVYIVAAGDIKTILPGGQIGIHRPYFHSVPQGDVEGGIKRLIEESKKYFSEMNIPIEIMDVMISTPPERMKTLTPDELERYRLNQRDIIQAEKIALDFIKTTGMSREDYHNSKIEIDSKCKIYTWNPEGMNKCFWEVMAKYGIQRPER